MSVDFSLRQFCQLSLPKAVSSQAVSPPLLLSFDTSSDSDTESVFDYSYTELELSQVQLSPCSCVVSPPGLKLTAIEPVTAKHCASGNFLRQPQINIRRQLLRLMEQNPGTPRTQTAETHKAVYQSTAGIAGVCNRPNTLVQDMPTSSVLTLKCRETRVNSDFLRRYALDYSARVRKILPMSTDDKEIVCIGQNPSLQEFDSQHGLLRISTMSREKLWNSVVLAPRLDARPRESIMHQQAMPCASVAQKNTSNFTTWQPAGVLQGAQHLHHSSFCTTVSTFTQYTIKGWCDQRWIVL